MSERRELQLSSLEKIRFNSGDGSDLQETLLGNFLIHGTKVRSESNNTLKFLAAGFM